MQLEDAFLQDICGRPDDDAPRLIYADWLEEQGGAADLARAELIRVQCELEGAVEDGPPRWRLQGDECDHLVGGSWMLVFELRRRPASVVLPREDRLGSRFAD